MGFNDHICQSILLNFFTKMISLKAEAAFNARGTQKLWNLFNNVLFYSTENQ